MQGLNLDETPCSTSVVTLVALVHKVVKISKFQKAILMSFNLPKTNTFEFNISALASNNWPNKKNKGTLIMLNTPELIH